MLTLPTIFAILFPCHELVGRNHRALLDCQQILLVMTAFGGFTKPIGSPGRLEFLNIKSTHGNLDSRLIDPTQISHHQETHIRLDGLKTS
jgi:hypothetical protein